MSSRESYTGKLAEDEVLGKVERDPNPEASNRYFSFDTLVLMAKESQPFKDPSDPGAPFPNDLHATIAEDLHLERYEQLKYYTAVGSKLDVFEGIDAFFELDLGHGENVRVTLDMTLNPAKEDYKADVVFQWPNEGISRIEDKEKWNAKINEVSYRIIEILKQKTEQMGEVIRPLSEYEIEESVRVASQKLKTVQRSRVHRPLIRRNK